MSDEFLFIKSITPQRHHQRTLIQGIGDDAALFRQDGNFNMIACVDTMVEDIHFKKSTMRPFHIGHKALAVNLSDIAAMGGRPTYYLVSLAVPQKGWTQDELHGIYEGMSMLADKFSVDLIGGDTVSSSSSLMITVTVLGQVETNRMLLRKNAEPGDVVFVTGTLGGAAAGLFLLLKKGIDYDYSDDEKKLLSEHQMPEPQIEAGRLFAGSGFRISLNDISDGIASEANELAEMSGTTFILNYDLIPVNNVLTRLFLKKMEQFVLYGGEDFELLGTVASENWPLLKRTFDKASIPLTNLKKLAKEGYNHFKENE